MNDSRSKILEAASELFLAGGLVALSVRAIANRAGLSTIGIYSHFDGKQGILDTLYIEGFERVTEAMAVSGIDVSDIDTTLVDATSRGKVMMAAERYLDVAEKYGAHYRLIFGEADEKYQPSEAARQAGERAFLQLTELAALLLPDDVSLLDKQKQALEIWAIVHGYVGLKNHAVSQLLDAADWRALILKTVERHLDSVLTR